MLRSRDWMALLLAVALARFAYERGSVFAELASIRAASIHLSWYLPRHSPDGAHYGGKHNVPPMLLDVNGDGVGETLAVVAGMNKGGLAQDTEQTSGPIEWTVQVLDLQPGMVTSAFPTGSSSSSGGGGSFARLAPFLPQTLLESAPMEMQKDIQPLSLTTGHVDMMSETTAVTVHDENDRTIHYYCGVDWHDASSKCATPCPSGTASECPGDEKCFADTPCLEKKKQGRHFLSQKQKSLETTTPAGSWPSIITLWSNGMIRMHSLVTNEKVLAANESKTNLHAHHVRQHENPLQVQLVWEAQLFPPMFESINNNDYDYEQNTANRSFVKLSRWQHSHITFLEHQRVPVLTNNHVLVTATVEVIINNPDKPRMHNRPYFATLIVTLDSKTGHVLWDNIAEYKDISDALQVEKEMEEGINQTVMLPYTRGPTSFARRRSYNPNLAAASLRQAHPRHGQLNLPVHVAPPVSCMKAYRRSLLMSNALPYMVWTVEDSHSHAIHVDHQHGHEQEYLHRHHHHHHHHKNKNGVAKKLLSGGKATNYHHSHSKSASDKSAGMLAAGSSVATRLVTSVLPSWLKSLPSSTSSSRASSKRRSSSPSSPLAFGRPNVVVTHDVRGMTIRSLNNGKALCKMGLFEENLYADINHDGLLDSLILLTGSRTLEGEDDAENDDDPDYKWVSDLVKRVAGPAEKKEKAEEESAESQEDKKEEKKMHMIRTAKLCHLLALSGTPSLEELFSTNVCGNDLIQDRAIPQRHNPEAAPPLAVDPIKRHRRNKRGSTRGGHDIITALNTGVVTRVDGSSGRIQWQIGQFQYAVDYPMWEDESLVLLRQLDSPHVLIPASRPLLLTGENSLAILSAIHGTLLTTIKYPQVATEKPILMDINGDGTMDVIVPTADAWWGYPIQIQTGASAVARIAVGLLLMGMMLALLRNRFGPQPGKRSTDA